MMSKNVIQLFKRTFSVAVEGSVKGQPSSAVASSSAAMRRAAEQLTMESDSGAGVKGDFWMRDPKTGNWIPESHFNEIDIAELRNKLLPHKGN